MPSELLTTEEAAALLGTNRYALYRHIRAGRITPAMKAGPKTGAYLFARSDVEALAAAQAAA